MVGLRNFHYGALDRLAQLYWYTVEFGLVEEAGGLKFYGAGIVSFYGESLFALDDPRDPANNKHPRSDTGPLGPRNLHP